MLDFMDKKYTPLPDEIFLFLDSSSDWSLEICLVLLLFCELTET